MKKIICDRCGNEMKIAYINIFIGRISGEPLDLCEYCANALYRFMGMNTAGYEKLDSEEGG